MARAHGKAVDLAVTPSAIGSGLRIRFLNSMSRAGCKWHRHALLRCPRLTAASVSAALLSSWVYALSARSPYSLAESRSWSRSMTVTRGTVLTGLRTRT